jgi:hypothetical protein
VLTPRIARYVRQHFEDTDAELVLGALEDWRISYEEKPPSERLTAAVVLAAGGTLEGIDSAFREAERDWRDLLCSAGLENEDWPQLLDLRLGPEAA